MFSTEQVLATEHMSIDSISDYSRNSVKEHFLPTLGPRQIDFYTLPLNLRVHSESCFRVDESCVDSNEPEGPYAAGKTGKIRCYTPVSGSNPGGGEYVSRLLMRISSQRAAQSQKVSTP